MENEEIFDLWTAGLQRIPIIQIRWCSNYDVGSIIKRLETEIMTSILLGNL